MNIPAIFTAIENLLGRSRPDLVMLANLAEPEQLGNLFCMMLPALIRRGVPKGPYHLITLAQQAAEQGLIPLEAVTRLTGALDGLALDCVQEGFWDSARKLWWEPMPEVQGAVGTYGELNNGTLGPHVATASLTEAFCETQAPGWLHLDGFLDKSYVARVHEELEAAYPTNSLKLERAGVGAEARISKERHDEARYFNGDEPELLAAAPSLAAFIQWSIRNLAGKLAAAAPTKNLTLRRGMLARYPAPSGGYHGHIDNPAGDEDNGRALTIVVYLNPEECLPIGGEIALWAARHDTAKPPSAILEPLGGNAILFNSRAVPHIVCTLDPGPARWAISFWIHDDDPTPRTSPHDPVLKPTDALINVPNPPLPHNTCMFRWLGMKPATAQTRVYHRSKATPRTGIVATVYRADALLDTWCRHHFAVGFDHLILIFDHLEEPGERATHDRLRQAWPEDRLTLWDGARLLEEQWAGCPDGVVSEQLLAFARSGSSSSAVVARQMFNASLALEKARGDHFGASPLDWLLHIDADELFVVHHAANGGASLGDHFAAAESEGLDLIRYVNHELLVENNTGPATFKMNPNQAALLLGQRAWRKWIREHFAQRPFFNGYTNGKSAVRVAAAGAAAGVHGWSLNKKEGPTNNYMLAGPSILHFHFSTAEAYRNKYFSLAKTMDSSAPTLFKPLPAETAALGLIKEMREQGHDDTLIAQHLESLRCQLSSFNEAQLAWLKQAGLLLQPDLAEPLTRCN